MNAQVDGAQVWAYTATSSSGAVTSSPAIGEDGTIYVGVEVGSGTSFLKSGRVLAILPNGSLRWQRDFSDWVSASPTVGADGTVYVGSWNGRFFALAGDTGAVKWEYATDSFIVSSAAIGPDGTIYVGGGDGNLHALTPAGALRWVYPTGDWVESSPAVGPDGTVYVGSWDGSVYAIASDGNLRWRAQSGAEIVGGAAVAADGTVYVGSRDRFLYAINANGSERWSLLMGEAVEASPVIGPDGTVYLGAADGRLRAVTPEGVVRWTYEAGGAIYATAAVRADGVVVVGADDGGLHAVGADGVRRWRFAATDWIGSSPVVWENRIYVGSQEKKLFALHSGAAEATTDWAQRGRTAGRSGWQPLGRAGENGGRLSNLSVRARGGVGDGVLIAGFVLRGEGPREVLARGVGPTLAAFGVGGVMADPRVQLFAGEGVVAENAAWSGAALVEAAARAGAFPLVAGSADAAVVGELNATVHTLHVADGAGVGGVALAEVYALGGDTATRLVNVSARVGVGTGAEVLIAGFVIEGGARAVLVRAVGPTLADFGVGGVLATPRLTVFRGAENLVEVGGVASSPTLLATAAADAGAFGLAAGRGDAVLVATLPPGAYTAQVDGVGGTTGVALVEVYVLP